MNFSCGHEWWKCRWWRCNLSCGSILIIEDIIPVSFCVRKLLPIKFMILLCCIVVHNQCWLLQFTCAVGEWLWSFYFESLRFDDKQDVFLLLCDNLLCFGFIFVFIWNYACIVEHHFPFRCYFFTFGVCRESQTRTSTSFCLCKYRILWDVDYLLSVVSFAPTVFVCELILVLDSNTLLIQSLITKCLLNRCESIIKCYLVV